MEKGEEAGRLQGELDAARRGARVAADAAARDAEAAAEERGRAQAELAEQRSKAAAAEERVARWAGLCMGGKVGLVCFCNSDQLGGSAKRRVVSCSWEWVNKMPQFLWLRAVVGLKALTSRLGGMPWTRRGWGQPPPTQSGAARATLCRLPPAGCQRP
jgi:hypothetical protein